MFSTAALFSLISGFIHDSVGRKLGFMIGYSIQAIYLFIIGLNVGSDYHVCSGHVVTGLLLGYFGAAFLGEGFGLRGGGGYV